MNSTPRRPTKPLVARGRRALLRAGASAMAVLPFVGLGGWALAVARASLPSAPGSRRWLVGPLARLGAQAITDVRTPAGARVRVHAPTDPSGRWLALRDECPHLGCRLRWDAATQEYLCPCHRGRFDARGEPLGGPPAAAGLRMLECDLVVERGLLFLVLPSRELDRNGGANDASDRSSAARASGAVSRRWRA